MADIIGDNSDETLDGTADDDLIQGLGGDDIIDGLGGNDRIEGGFGNNTLTGGAGNDVFAIVARGQQTHTITDFTIGQDRIDLSFLGVGSFDQLIPFLQASGLDTRLEFFAFDRIEAFVLQNIDRGDLSADDFIFNTDLTDLVYTISDGDRFQDFVFFGGLGNDSFTGRNGDDVFSGGAGDDVFNGGFGVNTIYTGTGADIVSYGARGRQTQTVKDFSQGSDKIDFTVLGVSNMDDLLRIARQDGDDVIFESTAFDQVERMVIENFDLADLTANDVILNTSLDPVVTSVSDGDRFQDFFFFGGAGNDRLTARNGDDTLFGGDGDDALQGGFGVNTLWTGNGVDTIVIEARGRQEQIVKDFDLAADRVDMRIFNVADLDTLMPYISQDGADTIIRTFAFDQVETIRLEGIDSTQLTTDNFRFNTFAADLEFTVSSGDRFQDFVVFGGNGNDDLATQFGDDELNGGAGNDDLDAGGGTNIIRGGAGNDDIIFGDRTSRDTTVTDFTIGEDRMDVRGLNVADFETLQPYLTQDGDDVLLQTSINGRTETFRLQNILLADLSASDFRFNTNAADLTVEVTSTTNESTLFGGNGNDTIIGGRRADDLNGGAGDDTLQGNAGDDALRGGQGADVLDGGDGLDRADYLLSDAAITIDLVANTVSGGYADGDTLISIEGANGTRFADTMTGNDLDNAFLGRGGDDIIDAGNGDNDVDGGDGNDMITIGIGRDDVNGGDGDDVITDLGGRGTLNGGAGNDRIIVDAEFQQAVIGGDGMDTLVLPDFINFIQSLSSGIAVGFNESTAASGRFSGIEFLEINGRTYELDPDQLRSAEASIQLDGRSQIFMNTQTSGATFAGDGDDYIIGNSGFLGTGQDRLFGENGNDTLIGNGGDDQLFGDTFLSLPANSLEGQLFRAYQAVFDRNPDEGGYNLFLTEMRLGRLNQEQVIAEFVASAEFQNTYGTLDNRAFVEQLYLNVLNREGDAAGITAFTDALDVGRSRASVVVEFANSAEFITLMDLPSGAFSTNVVINPFEGEVYRAYQAVFGREPDAGGFNAFVNSLIAGVLDIDDVVTEFVGSQEFQDTYGDLSDRDFVELLYTNVLPGNTDQVGRDAFTTALQRGELTRAEMVTEFVQSFEFRERTQTDAESFVADIFDASGSDVMIGGTGDDEYFGGRGDDLFIVGEGADSIFDFTSGSDVIDVSVLGEAFDTFAEIQAVGSQVGQDTVFDFGDGNTLTLTNVQLSDLTAADFGVDGGTAAEPLMDDFVVASARPLANEAQDLAFAETDMSDVVFSFRSLPFAEDAMITLDWLGG